MPRKRIELDRDEKIGEIVATAQRQLRNGGYSSLSIKRIASELGVAQAAVYWYFPTKDHLFVRAVESIFFEAWSRKPRSGGLKRQLQWFGDELAALQPYITVLRERAETSDVAADFAAGIEEQLRAILAGAIGASAHGARPQDVADVLLAMIEGLALRERSRQRRRRLVAFAVDALIER